MDNLKAIQALKAALELHAAHMNGTEPTSPRSQQKLMDLIERAYEALGGGIKKRKMGENRAIE